MKLLERRKKRRLPDELGDLLEQALKTNREAHRRFLENLQEVARQTGVELPAACIMCGEKKQAK